jgi:hypothetical protein
MEARYLTFVVVANLLLFVGVEVPRIKVGNGILM